MLTRHLAESYYNRGNFYYNDWYSIKRTVGIPEKAIEDLEKAIELYQAVIKLDPQNRAVYPEDIQWPQEYIQWPQEYIEAHFLLVNIYTETRKEPDIARGYLDEIIEIKGSEQNRVMLRKIAAACEKVGDQDKANEYFIKAGRSE